MCTLWRLTERTEAYMRELLHENHAGEKIVLIKVYSEIYFSDKNNQIIRRLLTYMKENKEVNLLIKKIMGIHSVI